MSGQQGMSLPEVGDELFAAEYVLGVLDADQRAIASARADNDAAFAGLVDRWITQLEPLNESYQLERVPQSVKQALDRRLFGEPEPKGFWSSIAFWRALAAGSLAALAVVLWPQIRTRPVTPPAEPIVASLQAGSGEVRFLALYQPGTDEIRVTRVKAEKASDRDFELWLVDNGGKPIAMGLLPDDGRTTVKLKHELALRISTGDALAVSDEPKGGSPTGEATGPVIAVGATSSI